MRGGWVENGTVLIQLTRQHFAFYRGYLEGLDLHALASRCLETMTAGEVESMDLRVVRSRVKWVREQLLVAARRAGKPTIARLVAIEPERLIVTYAKPGPTLEEFREERDSYEMFSEAELIELFQEEFGSGSRREARLAERNARLRVNSMPLCGS